MRFRIDPGPSHGDRRVKKKFAWFPVCMGGNDFIWFESYWAMQEYRVYYGGHSWYGWTTQKLGYKEEDTYLWRTDI